MNNMPFNSTQNVINVARELNLTIPEAQMLIQRASQGAQQGPLDMLIKPLSQQATNDAYRQIQSQVLRQAPSTIGQTVRGLGSKGLGQAGLLYGMYDAGKSMNNMYQRALMNNLLKGIQSYDNYMIEPSRKR